MNLLDIIIIMILVSFFAIGFKNGVIEEVFSLVGTIIIIIISYILKDWLGYYLCLYAPFFKFTGALKGISSFNIIMYQGISFLVIFCILLSVYAAIIKTSSFIQKIVNLTIILILPSKILGGIVGMLKGWLLIFMSLILLMLPLGNNSLLRESTLSKTVLYNTPIISKHTEKFTNSLKEVYDIVHKVTKEKITAKEADIKTMEILLKYKMVSKETVKKLMEVDKIENKKDMERLINNN